MLLLKQKAGGEGGGGKIVKHGRGGEVGGGGGGRGVNSSDGTEDFNSCRSTAIFTPRLKGVFRERTDTSTFI